VLGSAGGGEVGLGDLVVGSGEADFESFGFAGPAFAFGLGDAGQEVVADLFQSVPLGGVDAEEGAPDAGLSAPLGRCEHTDERRAPPDARRPDRGSSRWLGPGRP
jgi:hypothetical protein